MLKSNGIAGTRRFPDWKIVLLLVLLMLLAQGAFSVTQQFLSFAEAGMLPGRWAWAHPYRGLILYFVLQPLCFATLFGAPAALGLACAGGRLRLRFVFPLGLLYILLPLRLYLPLLSGLYGLFRRGAFAEPFCLGLRSLYQSFRQIFFSPIAACAGALILLALCPLIGLLVRRLPVCSAPSTRANRRFILCFALAFLLLAALTAAGERQVFAGMQQSASDTLLDSGKSDARAASPLYDAVHYILRGGQLAQQWLLFGGRLHQLWYCCCVFALACLYCAGKLRLKEAAAWAGIGLGVYAAAALLTPVSAELSADYYKGFNLFFAGSGIQAPHVPAVIVNGVMLLVPAALMLGLAALICVLGRGKALPLSDRKEESA